MIEEENCVYTERCRCQKEFFKRRNKSREKVYVADVAANSTVKQIVKSRKKRAFLFSMYLSAARREREKERGGRFISDVSASRGSVQDTLRGSRLRHPIFGPRTRDSPKTYYLIYDSHGHYLLATK